jgi:uncharacterized protein YlzI (FlbEa/FlbD family)
MIKLTRLNRNPLIVNSEEVVERVVAFRKLIFCRELFTPLAPEASSHGR